jgi:SAM-dependent methyltransferase
MAWSAEQSVTLADLFADATLEWDRRLIGNELETYQENALSRMSYYLDFEGLDVLEVGADHGNCLARLEAKGMQRGVGINNWRWQNLDSPRRASDRIICAPSEVATLPVQDESFDLIYSIATYEHILDLPGAFAEMHRMVKPGGLVYAIFGPLWTSLVGHHLWFDFRGRQYRFNDPESMAEVMDPYDHLLYEPDELRDKLRQRHDDEAVERYIYQIYESPHINRYSYTDYLDFVLKSPFEPINFKKTWEIPVPDQHKEPLEDKLGSSVDCSCAGLEIVLRKKS